MEVDPKLAFRSQDHPIAAGDEDDAGGSVGSNGCGSGRCVRRGISVCERLIRKGNSGGRNVDNSISSCCSSNGKYKILTTIAEEVGRVVAVLRDF